ncbi:MAG: flavin monoamine oxidase family protein [Nitratireductor sp.]
MTNNVGMSRRGLLRMIGAAAGAGTMYQAMTTLGVAQESSYKGQIKLGGDPKGATVLILGAGLAGLVAAFELRAAGYKVRLLEYREVAGGRCWTMRGGDTYTELGGFKQDVSFAKGNYFNPGPWRIPYHHHGVMDYCRRLGVELEPFIQVNQNAYLHSARAFGSRPQRFRHVAADFRGQISELLSKAVNQDHLDDAVTGEDKELLLDALRSYGVLDKDYAYVAGPDVSKYRGYDRDPGGGIAPDGIPSQTIAPNDLLRSKLWDHLRRNEEYWFQMPMFQPVGGMDMIAKAFEREVGEAIRYNAKVTAIKQDDDAVTVTYVDRQSGDVLSETADWCICTIPFSVLSQVETNLSAPMVKAIGSLPYDGLVKVGLEAKRRFWEEDEQIYGGISYTDLPISQMSYPSTGYHKPGPAVLLGGYTWGVHAHEFTSLAPEARVRKTLEYASQLHPQLKTEFLSGVSVAWHRVPWTLGCYGRWQDRNVNYKAAAEFDGRVVMAGEHISQLPAWQEGAVLSSLDTVARLHKRVVSG